MIINCPNCNKNFEIDNKLIPSEGRLLQCGSCNHKWFFKTENNEEKLEVLEKNISETTIEDNNNSSEQIKENILNKNDDSLEPSNNLKNDLKKKANKKSDINYFKILVVIIISFFALILILETFKEQISIILPNIEIILDNLYQSINDIKLFILDLIK